MEDKHQDNWGFVRLGFKMERKRNPRAGLGGGLEGGC